MSVEGARMRNVRLWKVLHISGLQYIPLEPIPRSRKPRGNSHKSRTCALSANVSSPRDWLSSQRVPKLSTGPGLSYGVSQNCRHT